MRTQIVTASLFLSILTPITTNAEIPLGGKEFVGWLIYQDDRADTSPSVSEIRFQKEKLWVLRNKKGNLLASMRVPDLSKGFEYNYGNCKVDGVYRNDVIAVVKHRRNKEWSSVVNRSWIIDPTKPGFESVTPKGIICRNEGYGV